MALSVTAVVLVFSIQKVMHMGELPLPELGLEGVPVLIVTWCAATFPILQHMSTNSNSGVKSFNLKGKVNDTTGRVTFMKVCIL
jgi:hypothetical protein